MRVLAILLASLVAGQAAPDPVRFYLPFAFGKRVVVFRGNGEGSHADVYNRYAFDFTVPVGTPVHASASGEVVFVKQDTPGPTGKWRDNNEVTIRHADGTFAVYHHLKKDPARTIHE